MSSIQRLSSFLYQNIFRKTSTFVLFIGVTAILADRTVDVVAETAWEKINEGRLWKDVRKQLNLDAPK